MPARNGYEPGGLLHHAIVISLFLLFIASLGLLVCSIKYGKLLTNDPDFLFSEHGAQLVFYLGTMPVLTLTHTVIQLLLSHRDTNLSPTAMIFIASIFIPGWLVVASIWTDCEFIQPNGRASSLPSWCPQSILSNPTAHGHVFNRSLTNVRDSLAWVLAATYVAYLVLAVVAWRKEKKADEDKDFGLGKSNMEF